jgi:uncharacterized protein (UPF0335 family)
MQNQLKQLLELSQKLEQEFDELKKQHKGIIREQKNIIQRQKRIRSIWLKKQARYFEHDDVTNIIEKTI